MISAVQKAQVRLNDPDLNLILREFQRPYIMVAGEAATRGRSISEKPATTAMQAILWRVVSRRALTPIRCCFSGWINSTPRRLRY